MTHEDENTIAQVIDIAQLAADPKELSIGKVYAVTDGDRGLKLIDTMDYLPHLPHPDRMKRKVLTLTPESFIAYIKEYGDTSHAEVYAKADPKPRLVCVFDADKWREDRVYLDLKTSPEWEAWISVNGKLVSQATFADFIEDQISTIADPVGVQLLEIVQSLEANTKVDWKSAIYLPNGERQFTWSEQIEAKAGRTGQLAIPAQFTLALRPFLGADPFEVKGNLRYRINNGDLTIGIKLVEPDRRMEVAIADVAIKVATETNLTILAGWPDFT